MAWRRSGAPRGGAHPDDPDPAERSAEPARDDSNRRSRAPTYWDDLDDRGGTPAPGPDVLATGWERPPPRRRQRTRRSAASEPAPYPEAHAPPESGHLGAPPGSADESTLTAPETGSQVPDSAESEEELAPAPDKPRPALVERVERWAQYRRTRLLWISAFLVGALVGGVAVHSWEADRAAAERRDAVQLAARVAEDAASSASWTGSRQPWTLRIVLTNNGPTDVRVETARLADGRFRSSLRSVSRGIRIRAGQEAWLSMEITHSCAGGGPAPAPRAVDLTVVPAGRPERDVQVRLADDSALVVDTARQKCLSPASDLWTTAELAGEPAEVESALAIPVRIRQIGTATLAVREIRTSSPGLSVVAAPLPVRFVNNVTPTTTLRWSVADCARAKVVNYAEIAVTATVQLANSGQSIRTTVVLDANAVLAIVRFITRSCE